MNNNHRHDVYERLGVRKLINAWGVRTSFGGSCMAPEVISAMAEAAEHFVNIDELLAKSGAYVAGLIGVEAAYITVGASAGLVLATAACVAGDDPARIERLPDTRGMPHRVAVHRRHRNGYDQAVRQIGVEFVEFGWIKETVPWQLEAAIDDETVAVFYVVEFAEQGSLPLETVVEIAHRHHVPVIVDAAGELPPVSNLRQFNDLGADVVVFSGGKDIQGPQSSGLILGRQDLIRACALNGSPNYSIGRPMKAGKEEIIALVVAIERYLAQDQKEKEAQWEAQVAYLVETLGALPGVNARRACPTPYWYRPATVPQAYIEWNAGAMGITGEEASRILYNGDPPIAVHHTLNGLGCNPQVLVPGEERVVAERISALLCARKRMD